jgi:hypothetical protein
MTARGSIVAGSVTDLVLGYLREHPGGWTLEHVAAALGYPRRQVSVSLDSLCTSNRAQRWGARPARYRYVAPEKMDRSCADIIAGARRACWLYGLQIRPGSELRVYATGMPKSAKNRMHVFSFQCQKSGREDRPRHQASPRDRARVARLGAQASIWRRRAAV